MDEINRRGATDDEDVKARLDRLAADPKALEAYYRSVYNKVHIDGNAAPGGRVGRTPERDLRNRIDALVGNAVTAPQAAATGGFVSSLRPEAQEREAQMRTIAVQPGDTLGIIAKRAYGDASQYMKIFEANPRVLTSPHHIFPGQILRVPAG
ncbi:MAG: LysM peptidoglycan-binding domain-containing protein [Betaproteobacteria bacterium]|nr:LysM peptidoglycan-binding domain-containing protein [Betaproteobacteria bacterium]